MPDDLASSIFRVNKVIPSLAPASSRVAGKMLRALSSPEPICLMDFDFVTLDFDRDDIEAGDTSDVMTVLMQLLERDAATKFCERVDVCCTGYAFDPRELWEIPEIRDFVYKVDQEFPFWCYFLSRKAEGLLWLTYCLYPLAVTQEEKKRLWPSAIAKYIEDRGIPSMNAICRFVGCTNEEDFRSGTDNVGEYL